MLNCYFICYGTYNHLVKDDGRVELVCGIWFLTSYKVSHVVLEDY